MILLDRTTVDYNQVNRELKQMIASVSHDFRTPLTSIIGYLDLLEDPDTDEAAAPATRKSSKAGQAH